MPVPSRFKNAPVVIAASILALGCGGGGGGSAAAPAPAGPTITAFTAQRATITAGDSTLLTATFPSGTGSIDHGVGTVVSGDATGVTPAATTTYTLTVTDQGRSSTRQTTVTVVPAPVATVSLSTGETVAGTAGLTASVPDQPGSTYAWSFGGCAITAGEGTHAITFTAGSDPTAYVACHVTNAAGAEASGDNVMTVHLPASIAVGPQSQAALIGGTATFSVQAAGDGPLSFTWLRNQQPIPGATGATLEVGPASLADDQAQYAVEVGNAYGSARSSNAILSVQGRHWRTGDTAHVDEFSSLTALPDGRVLVAGGFRDDRTGSSDTSELYDPATGTFSPSGTLTSPRTNHTATLLATGKVLLVAGSDDQSSAELYDPATGSFSPTGSLLHRRFAHTAALLLDGRVLVAGGGNAEAELYDPVTGTFSATGSLSVDRRQAQAVALADGRVVILGGRDGDGALTRVVEVYDPAHGTFSRAGDMIHGRIRFGAARTADGHVLVAGGFTDEEPNGTAQAERFEPGAGSFQATPPMSVARPGCLAVALPNGYVLVTGGNEGAAPVPDDLYNPGTGYFDPTLTLPSVQRYSGAGALTAEGDVLLLGGTSSSRAVDVYDLHHPVPPARAPRR